MEKILLLLIMLFLYACGQEKKKPEEKKFGKMNEYTLKTDPAITAANYVSKMAEKIPNYTEHNMYYLRVAQFN